MGAFLGPIMSGNIAAKHGWRSFFWLSTALSLFATLLVAVAQPETKYHRTRKSNTTSTVIVHVPEKQPTSEDVAESNDAITPESSSGSSAVEVGRGRPSRSQFALYQRPDSQWRRFIIRDLTTPIRVFFNPIVFWAGLMLAGSAELTLIFNLTESLTLAAPPYNWSAGAVGYANFGFAVGGIVGVATAGPLSDCKTISSSWKIESLTCLRGGQTCDAKEQRHPRGRNASSRSDPIRRRGNHRTRMRRLRNPATLVLAEDRGPRLRPVRTRRHLGPDNRHRLRHRLLQTHQRGDYGRRHGAEEPAGLLLVVLDL